MSKQKIREQLERIARHKDDPKYKGVYGECVAVLRRRLLRVIETEDNK